MAKEERELAYEIFKKNWVCPRCGKKAGVFMFCKKCWPSIYGQFELDHRGRSLSQREWA